jgi:hypothetical protein
MSVQDNREDYLGKILTILYPPEIDQKTISNKEIVGDDEGTRAKPR